jgi:2-polyprenyl-3-methyl-5-hydroxy-6-metoxy-1,4-benzoquinol methylase
VKATACWCGAGPLIPFSPDYRRCPGCGGLVVAVMPEGAIARVEDDARDLYGEDYWFGHQSKDFGYPDIQQRARADLPERCTHWLRALLRFKLPPARALEIGAAHGGFVALMRQAGFEASGLELSPAIVAFARRTFGVPMAEGIVEEQSIAPRSLDVVAMFDVLEHLQDPIATIRHCLELLAPDGLLLVQTPRVSRERSFEDLVRTQDTFLAHFKPDEHLFLFSEDGARELMRRSGVGEIRFLPAIFAHYDMFFVASRAPLRERSDDEIAAALQSPPARMALALVDLHRQYEDAARYLASASRDAAERLTLIEQMDARLRVIDRDARLRQGPGPVATMRRWIRALAGRGGRGPGS